MTSFSDMMEGHARFRERLSDADIANWREQPKGQQPKVMVISCVDSRVAPEQLLDTKPGELFVMRNVANIVPPYAPDGRPHSVSSALEFAVTKLNVEELVVIGHQACGGVGACLSRVFANAEPGDGGLVNAWVKTLDPARERVVAKLGTDTGPEAQHALELEGVRESLGNLMTYPFVRERVEDGTLKLRGAWFGIGDARLHVANEQGEFQPA
ncbi:carbonic anhydrase [Sphingomonas lenta]|uniref:Carbonic anhydrase n=1 Tax=Sphingomonas lenta TaxID=1141887 RepID=A0A2A2SK57_9SPHN|nr:carbonic anhydrase [Sphingomonas lenta]PAX09605.1 carbonate dehydratase [Sphingomonas lenta]